jgi:hypothetical protein
MSMRVLTFVFLVILLVLAMTGGAPFLYAAESACKGLTTDACGKKAECSWVDPYKTKKGKEIAGFCRKKAVRKSEPKPTKSS